MNLAHCIACGCHDYAACYDQVTGGGCSWLAVDREAGKGVCSVCPEALERWNKGDREIAVSDLGRELGPAARPVTNIKSPTRYRPGTGHSTLAYLAAEVEAAQRQVDTAASALASDKSARNGSLLARIRDAVTTTSSEAALHDAQARLATARRRGRAEAVAWVRVAALSRLEEEPAEAARHQEQVKKVARMKGRAGQVRRWFELAQAAASSLSAAHRACKSASTTELMDLVSTSKAISSLSYMDTSDAANSIKGAGRAVRALEQALPKHVAKAEIDVPDDLLDFVVDLVFDPGIDVLSWTNMLRLEDAARQCQEVLSKVRPLLDRLGKLAAGSQAKFEQEAKALCSIEAPFFEEAARRVPELLRVDGPFVPGVARPAK